MSHEKLAQTITEKKFIFVMSAMLLISAMWFFMKWGEHSFVQALSILGTGYLISQAAVEFKHKPKELT